MKDLDKFDIIKYMTNEENKMFCYSEGQNDICLFEFKDMYVKQVEPKFPIMVCTQVLYYSDSLGVKEKGKYLKHGGISIGEWEYFKEDGTLDHTEDMDVHFPIRWEQMEQILKDNKISLLTAYSINRYIDKETNKPIWTIGIKISETTGLLHTIDAQTGEILSRKTTDLRKVL